MAAHKVVTGDNVSTSYEKFGRIQLWKFSLYFRHAYITEAYILKTVIGVAITGGNGSFSEGALGHPAKVGIFGNCFRR